VKAQSGMFACLHASCRCKVGLVRLGCARPAEFDQEVAMVEITSDRGRRRKVAPLRYGCSLIVKISWMQFVLDTEKKN
jgi:hypothetical protein